MSKLYVFLAIFLFSYGVHAEDMSIYEADVSVDATAEDSATAREKAMTEANRKALYAITNRISTASSTNILDNLNNNQILNFIKEVAVISEKVSENRYFASLKVTINAPILKAYLAEKDAPVTIMQASNIIIIPVFHETETSPALLWEDNNLWYQSWQNNSLETGQIKITPLAKTADNQELIDASDALQLNGISLDGIARKTGSNDIFVAEAIPQSTGIQVKLLSFKQGPLSTKTYGGELVEAFDNATQDIKSTILQQIQKQTLAQENAHNKITMVYNYNALKEWVDLQNDLRNINIISNINIDAMGNHRVQMSVEYDGIVDSLIEALNTKGIKLTNSDNFYIIERY